jgi:hypothetical protein
VQASRLHFVYWGSNVTGPVTGVMIGKGIGEEKCNMLSRRAGAPGRALKWIEHEPGDDR